MPQDVTSYLVFVASSISLVSICLFAFGMLGIDREKGKYNPPPRVDGAEHCPESGQTVDRAFYYDISVKNGMCLKMSLYFLD